MPSTPYVIYGLADPRTQEIRYVGKSKSVATRRGYRPHTPVGVWLTQLKTEGLKPTVLILEANAEDDWKARERFWIAAFREQGSILNVCSGGNGSHDYAPLPEFIAAMLGKIPDEHLAFKMGLTRKAIAYHRKSKGIPAAPRSTRNISPSVFKPGRVPHNRLNLPDLSDLGLTSDMEMAERLGVNKSTVRRRRVKRGLPASKIERRHSYKAAKLTTEQVLEIRALHTSMSRIALAKKFSIHLSTLHRILTMRTWTHI